MKILRKTIASTILGAVVFSLGSSLTSSAQLLQPWKLTPIKAAPPVPAIPVLVTNTSLPVTVSNALTIANPVTVGNATTNPVPTRDVDNSANEPYEFYVCLSGGTLASFCTSDPIHLFPTQTLSGKTIKRFVSEYISGSCQTADDTHFLNAGVRHAFSGGGFGLAHTIPLVSMPGNPGTNFYAFGQQVKLYGNPGEGMAGGFAYWGGGNYFCGYTIAGYFVTQ